MNIRILTRIARFADPNSVDGPAIPPASIIRLQKMQIVSMIAAILHGTESPYFPALLAGIKRRRAGGFDPRDLAFLFSALSMAHDYDDFLFAGHTGHSSVIVPLCFAPDLGAGGADLLSTQFAGNEIGARLGASLFFGNQNGQLWSAIHQLVPAVQIARLRTRGMKPGAAEPVIRSAASLSLAHPVFALWDTFFSSPAKVLTAAMPLLLGIRAGIDADGFLTGPDPFDRGSDFYRHFSFLPVMDVWNDLGERFYSETLSFKKYPGCAYIASPVECCERIRIRLAECGGSADDIRGIDIHCNMLSKKMNDLSRAHLRGAASTPTTLNFSLPINCALMLTDGALTPRSFLPDSLARAGIWELAGRIRVFHDPSATMEMMRKSSLVPGALRLLLEHPVKLLPYFRRHGALVDFLSLPVDLLRVLRLRFRAGAVPYVGGTPPAEGSGYALHNGASVAVTMTGGAVFVERVRVPTGFAGSRPGETAEMLDRKLAAVAGKEAYRKLTRFIDNIEDLPASGVSALRDLALAELLRRGAGKKV